MDATALVSALLRRIDPAADVVECDSSPDGLGYRVQLRIHGDTSKMAHLPAGLLNEAAAGNAVAVRTTRLALQALLLDSRAAPHRARLDGRRVPMAP